MVNKKRKPIYLTFMLSLVAVLLFACSGGGSANQNEPAPQANNDRRQPPKHQGKEKHQSVHWRIGGKSLKKSMAEQK